MHNRFTRGTPDDSFGTPSGKHRESNAILRQHLDPEWKYFDDPDPTAEKVEEKDKRVFPGRKCFCVRSYKTGRLLAICPHHMAEWGVDKDRIAW